MCSVRKAHSTQEGFSLLVLLVVSGANGTLPTRSSENETLTISGEHPKW